ncbi:hypothetical protein GCM10009727_85990 [Actinomadura napierensis]|uniref:DUF4241 domain-containing protein n=1 Tax=Actinomadura napierensis TaxID=267854 RepID=A0ABN3AFY7_9ACTN
MFFDSLDVSYGEMWGSWKGAAHPDPMSRAAAARRHATGRDYAVLLAAGDWPLALIEFWPGRMWRVYQFDDAAECTQMIDFKRHRPGTLRVVQNVRWWFASEERHSSRQWDVQETTTVSADGQVEVRSESAGAGDAEVRRISAPVEDFLCLEPEFGDWQVFVRFLTEQGHEPAASVVLNEPADEGRGPLRATGIERLFTPGPRDTPDGPAAIEVIDAGSLRVPSGRLAVSDPGWITEPLRTIAVPPGEFPVTVSLMRTTGGTHVAAARVTLLDAPPCAWEMALEPGEDPGLLGEGQFYGVGVDAGTAAFLDAARTVSEEEFDGLIEHLDGDGSFTTELDAPEPEPNLIAFRAGHGDGSYPVWIGRTDDGRVGRVVIDFQLLPAEPRPAPKAPPRPAPKAPRRPRFLARIEAERTYAAPAAVEDPAPTGRKHIHLEKLRETERLEWGGRFPTATLRAVPQALSLVRYDADLVHEIDAAGPGVQRGIAEFAARRAATEAGLADLAWVAPALAALAQGRPLPFPFDRADALWALLADFDVPDRTVGEAVPPRHEPTRSPVEGRETEAAIVFTPEERSEPARISQPHMALSAILRAGDPHALTGAVGAVSAGVATFGEDYPAFLQEVRDLCRMLRDSGLHLADPYAVPASAEDPDESATLAAPVVVEAVDGLLDTDVIEGITVRVPADPGMAVDHVVQVRLVVGNAIYGDWRPVTAPGEPMDFTFDIEHGHAAAHYGEAKISYQQFLDEDTVIAASKTLRLRVR